MPFPQPVLDDLSRLWQRRHNRRWLFPNRRGDAPINNRVLSDTFAVAATRGPQERSGEVTLDALIDGQLRCAAVEFGEGIYSQAVQAHDQRQRVACAGDLVKERGGFRLQNPRHFRILSGEEAP